MDKGVNRYKSFWVLFIFVGITECRQSLIDVLVLFLQILILLLREKMVKMVAKLLQIQVCLN